MKEEDEIKRKRVKLRCNFVVIYWRFKPSGSLKVSAVQAVRKFLTS
jgi:hypothetical protein